MTTFERVVKSLTLVDIVCYQVDEYTALEDLPFDSLDDVQAIMYLEEEFGIAISEEEAEKWNTVGDIVRWIDGCMEYRYCTPQEYPEKHLPKTAESKSLSWWQDRVKNLDMTISIVHGDIVVDFFDSRVIECKDEEELEQIISAIEILSERME